MSSFNELGFLSDEVEATRLVIREQLPAEFAQVEAAVRLSIAELAAVQGSASPGYLVAMGYWLKCIESCQGAVLLIERGLPGAPYPVLRTAFECLFFACAVWRKPELLDKLKAGHDAERVKQANLMLAAGAAARVTPGRLADLQAIAAEPTDGTGVSAWEAANAADLVFEYQTAYRGFGIAGAHATARSLDDYVEQLEDGSFTLGLEPGCERTAWLLGLVVTCLSCGTGRHREARAQELALDAGAQGG